MQSRKYFLRAFFFVFLLTCLLTGLVGTVRIPLARAVSSTIVISQVYGGGGNTNAPYTNDFVELFNLGSSPVSINGWTIQYTGATGTSFNIIATLTDPPSGSLAPGQYYLVTLGSGGAAGVLLPTADASGTASISATAGKVALVNNSTALSVPCPTGGNIVDFIGYGTTANCSETANAPAPSNTTADVRVTNGCTDTDNNSTDFAASAPTPRNTSSPTNVCPPPTATSTATDTATITNTPTNTSTPTLTFTPSNTPIFSLTPTLTPTPGDVIISEVAWMGTAASTSDEWIELYNTRASSINLAGWRLVNSSGSVDIVLSGTIPANGFFLLERAHDLTVSDVAADQIYTGALADTNDNLTLSKPDGTISDTANSNGGAWPAGTGAPNFYSMERVVVGGVPMADIDLGWVSSTNSALWTKHDAAGSLIHGTPNGNNWGFTVTATGTATASPTASKTSTPTRTLTPTRTPTLGLCATTASSVVISEVAWGGTAASSSDEWIELYNPSSTLIDLTNWKIRITSGSTSVNIILVNDINPLGFFLLERTDDNTVLDVVANQIFTADIANSGVIMQLFDATGKCVDSANGNGGNWPAGTASPTYYSMERLIKNGVPVADSDGAWITNNNSTTWKKHDASGNLIHGTPGYGNWAATVTPTPSKTSVAFKTSTPFKFRTSTPVPLPPPPLVAINEFVPRPGHDWNNDGEINIGDEYVELLNHGVVDVNLSGYRLDDEANIGSTPFGLPSVVLKPGQRMVFYESQTGIHLDDGGDGVRLIKPNGQLADAYNYSVVKYPDQSYCRLPDNGGLDDWNQNCAPTPGLRNAPRNGFGNLPVVNGDDNSCPIGDTLPLDFLIAECEPFGNNIWSRLYWDSKGWLGEKILPNTNGQWDVYGD